MNMDENNEGENIYSEDNFEEDEYLFEEENFLEEIFKGTYDKCSVQISTPKTQQSTVPNEEPSTEIVLEPNHPLLIKFQQTLKEQLTKQIEKLTEEYAEIEIEIKKKTTLHDELGVEVYDAQQIVNRQQEMLNDCEDEFKKVISEREELENEVNEMRIRYKEINDTLKEAEKKDQELRHEVESISNLMQQMTEWQDKLQSDLTVNQRIVDKTKSDNIQYTEEKKKLDFIIYKLTNDIFTLENNIEHLNIQLEAKEKNREELADKIADVTADLEGLEREHKRLMHSWNSVIVAIAQRDKTFFETKNNLNEAQEKLRIISIEMDTLKKLCNEEMMRNEQLTLIKARIDEEMTLVNNKLTYEKGKINHTEVQLAETHAILTQTEKDYEYIIAENKVKENDLKNLEREIEQQILQKVELEEKILELLQDQITNDKVSKYMNKKIQALRQKNRDCEIQLARIENQNSETLVEIEKQRGENEEAQRYIDELNMQINNKKQELNKSTNQFNTMKNEICKKQRNVDILLKRIEECIEKAGGLELAPEEIKINALEREIIEKEEKNKYLQSFWLRQQSYVVTLTEKRQKQLNEINIIERQLLLITQKNLTLEDELEKYENEERKINANIENLHVKLGKLTETIGNRKGIRETMDKETFFIQNEFYLSLKDAELACIRLENEISDIEEAKVVLSKQLIEVNREALVWERKNMLAAETKQHIDKEKGSEGELGAMKAEIHRMTVRYSQLKKAQDKLIQDLDHCVLRRESILYNAEATEKRMATGNKVNNRYNFKRKIEDVKVKLKKQESERKMVQKQIDESKKLQNTLKEELKLVENDMEDLIKQKANFQSDIENNLIERQKELEILLYKQHMVRAYSNIVIGDYKMIYRTKSQLDLEYTQQQEINANLQTIVESLLADFPKYRSEFAKILNTLKLTSY